MQIQRPNDKVTSLLITESDKWHFLRACKEINQSISSSWWSTSAISPLKLSLPLGLHGCNGLGNPNGRSGSTFPGGSVDLSYWWGAMYHLISFEDTIFSVSPSQKNHHIHYLTKEQTHGTYFLQCLGLNQGLRQRRCVESHRSVERNNSRILAAVF